MKFHLILATAAALLAATSLTSTVSAGDDRVDANTAASSAGERAGDNSNSNDSSVAALDARPARETARTIDLKIEPIEQPAIQPAPEAASATIEDAKESHDTAAVANAPTESKRVCRKFSAAIATVIEVPCE